MMQIIGNQHPVWDTYCPWSLAQMLITTNKLYYTHILKKQLEGMGCLA